MHEFDFINRPKYLLTPEVVALLTRLHECRGRQELFIEAEPDILTALLEVAKIQSTDASNRIEGIYTTDERLKAIVQEKVNPVTAMKRKSPAIVTCWQPSTNPTST